MAKDPAFLFYSSDFLTGTTLFSFEQKGIYIFLLCLQHQQGGICEDDMQQICGTHLKHIIKKFEKKEDGLYYQNRLQLEIEKRKKYSESRANNRVGKTLKDKPVKPIPPKKTYVPHMENENEDINRVKKRNKKGVQGEKETPTEFWQPLVDVWFNFYKSKKDMEPTFDGLQTKSLKAIVENLKKRSGDKGYEWTEAKATETLGVFLEYACRDKWLFDNLLLTNLNSKFDTIVAPKTGKKGNSTLDHLDY